MDVKQNETFGQVIFSQVERMPPKSNMGESYSFRPYAWKGGKAWIRKRAWRARKHTKKQNPITGPKFNYLY